MALDGEDTQTSAGEVQGELAGAAADLQGGIAGTEIGQVQQAIQRGGTEGAGEGVAAVGDQRQAGRTYQVVPGQVMAAPPGPVTWVDVRGRKMMRERKVVRPGMKASTGEA